MTKHKQAKDNKDNKDYKQIQNIINTNLNTLFADSVSLFTRTDRKILLSFSQQLPTQHGLECARILIERDHAERLTDILCKNLDYYPEKEKLNSVETA